MDYSNRVEVSNGVSDLLKARGSLRLRVMVLFYDSVQQLPSHDKLHDNVGLDGDACDQACRVYKCVYKCMCVCVYKCMCECE
jgi:hypothetical protein